MGLVAKIAQLTGLSPQAEQWLSENAEVRSFSKNEEILPEGKTCNYLYYVRSGMLGGYYFRDDKQVCNWISVENDFATSYYSFISRRPSYETILSMENTSVQCISFAKLKELYRLFPETERAGRLILEEYYMRLEERVISIQFKSAKERYDHLYHTRPEIIKRAPLGRIASYLGMSQETLSRVRTEK
jgi:CRP-like cAMP-binding protein